MTRLVRSLLSLVGAIVLAASAEAATFGGVSYHDSGDVTPGEWNGQFSKTKSYADAKGVPLVVVWVNPGCGYCANFESGVMANSSALSWMRTRGYLFVYAINGQGDAASAYSFINMSGGFPFCRVYWKNHVSSAFSPRSMSVKTFTERVDNLVGAWANVQPVSYPLAVTVSPSGAGTVTGAGDYPAGKTVALKATAGEGYVFSGWYSGSTLKSQASSYSVVTTSAKTSLTAKFVARTADKITSFSCPLRSSYTRGVKISPVTVTAAATSLPTVKVTGLPSGLSYSASTGKISGTPSRNGIYTAVATLKTAGGLQRAITNEVVVGLSGEYPLYVACDATMGKVTGAGVYAPEKSVTLKATPLRGHVFIGWYDGADKVSSAAKFVAMTGKAARTLTARFVTVAEDLASVRLSLDGADLSASETVTNEVPCGVQFRWPVETSALTPTTVTASGLPSGLKLVRDKVTLAYSVVGVPTKAGIRTATIKVKSAGGTVSFRQAFDLTALPKWAAGTFAGYSAFAEDGSGIGAASLSVSAGGKLSGKFAEGGTNWTCSANGYVLFDPEKGGTFAVTAKTGRVVRAFDLRVTPGAEPYPSASVAAAHGEVAPELGLERNFWKDGLELPPLSLGTFNPDEEDLADVTVKVMSGGRLQFGGKLADGSRVSASGLAFLSPDGGYACRLVVPTTARREGWMRTFQIPSDE